MRLILVVCAVTALVGSASASAKTVNAPSGNSGLSQYLEVVPSSGGHTPSKAPKGTAAANAATPPIVRSSDTKAGQERSDGKSTGKRKAQRQRHQSQAEKLLNRFVAQTSPGAGAAGLEKSAPDSRPKALAATFFGGGGGLGLGILLPVLLIGAVIAAALFHRRSTE